jgi:hypothetical protein
MRKQVVVSMFLALALVMILGWSLVFAQDRGSLVNYAPLVYHEFQGWDSSITVQNLSPNTNAKVKVYFIDTDGVMVAVITDWICPRGSRTFHPYLISDLPSRFMGSARIESLEWWDSGDPPEFPPYINSVIQAIGYEGPARAEALEAISYSALSEQEGADLIAFPSWQKGSCCSLDSEIAVQNLVAEPGFTEFDLLIYDQNGLVDSVSYRLKEKQMEFITPRRWSFINPGFKGSVLISVTRSQHRDTDSPRLGAVRIERQGGILSSHLVADGSTGTVGIPVRRLH